jgi:hypothetical protein
MAIQVPLNRLLLALTDDQLEEFVRTWIAKKKQYYSVERFTGSKDRGRDVVGYLTKERFEGSWHNYQCKQYGRVLGVDVALAELGKLLYYASLNEFPAPDEYVFVAPRGLARTLEALIAKPSKLKATLLDEWGRFCSEKIVAEQSITLTPALREFLSKWDFSKVRVAKVDDILNDSDAAPALQQWFGIDPGPAPAGVVPDEIQKHELPYVQQLVDAYGERAGAAFSQDTVKTHEFYGPHLTRQRERFFEADSFTRFYRDNTMQADIDVLRRDVRHGVAETHEAEYGDSLARADAVMTQAGVVQVSGALAQHARVPVKQGICHHFANEGTMKWRKM